MQIGFYFDQSRCTGCCTCVVACKDWYDVPAGPASRARITVNESGRYPHPSLSYLFSACWHCADPSCVEACPVKAISKRQVNGIVVVDRERAWAKTAASVWRHVSIRRLNFVPRRRRKDGKMRLVF